MEIAYISKLKRKIVDSMQNNSGKGKVERNVRESSTIFSFVIRTELFAKIATDSAFDLYL